MSEDKRILDFELEILKDADQFLCQQNENYNLFNIQFIDMNVRWDLIHYLATTF